MDLYEVVIAPKALAQLESYIDYIQYTLMNEQAASEVWQDAIELREHLTRIAGSIGLCSHPRLREMAYRATPFLRHRYVMLYRLTGNTVYVDAVYHQLQDYENTFGNE